MRMFKRRVLLVTSPLVLLKLIIIQSTIVYSLSISQGSSNSKNSLTNTNSNGSRPSANQLAQVIGAAPPLPPSSSSGGQQQTQPQQVTTLPPSITTISQNNYLDSMVQQQQQQVKQQHQSNQQETVTHSSNELRANTEEHDDTVPMATINNHSRNNQPAPRPPQYVDVSALVGRDRNLTSSTSSTNNQLSGNGGASQSSLAATIGGASSLTAKSRSGLPECATQQVCNAIFVRMNYTQKLCECSSNYNWKCSHNLDPQDGHTIELTRKFDKRIYTQIKTCEPLREVRACKSPTDWTLLALQSERSGKAHYVVVCKCPTWAQLEGPYTHNHPPYANIPGIRVYGMLCAHQTARSSAQTYATYNPALSIYPEFPWSEALNVLNNTNLLPTLNSH